jgi:hypothetical protein
MNFRVTMHGTTNIKFLLRVCVIFLTTVEETPINYKTTVCVDYVQGSPTFYKMRKGLIYPRKMVEKIKLASQYNFMPMLRICGFLFQSPNVPSWRTSLSNYIMERTVRQICYFDCAFTGCSSLRSKVVIMETKTGFVLFRVQQAGCCIRNKRTWYHSATQKQRHCQSKFLFFWKFPKKLWLTWPSSETFIWHFGNDTR